jgi:predicted alpha-1,6-mannanase (GH76 family)
MLRDNYGEKFNFENEVLWRLNKKLHSDVSYCITQAKLFALVDACRGKESPRRRQITESKLPGNMMVAYSTREGKYTYDGNSWMQAIAQRLKKERKSVGDVVSNLKWKKTDPILWNTGVPIYLHEGM